MSQKYDFEKLIAEHNRRLQKLKEQKARFGINTPPEVLTEIEDIEAEIDALYKALARHKQSRVTTPDPPQGSRAREPGKRRSSFWLWIGIGLFILVVIACPTLFLIALNVPEITALIATSTPQRPTDTSTPHPPTGAATATRLPVSESTVPPTQTNTPLPTSAPTDTPLPTSVPTATPTPTDTPLPEPALEVEYPRDESGRSKGLGYLVIAESAYYGAILLVMNETRPPLHDIRVRKAIDYSVPYAQTQAVVADGVPSPIEEYNLGPVQEYDLHLDPIEAARTFLAEAGYPDGFRTNIVTDNSLTYYGKIALALEDALVEANIEVGSEIVPSAQLDERIASGDYDIVIIVASRLN